MIGNFTFNSLWLLLLSLPLIGLYLFLQKKRNFKIIILEILGFCSLLAALAQPVWREEDSARGVVVAIDRSGSISADYVSSFKKKLSEINLPLDSKYVTFAGGIGDLLDSLDQAYGSQVTQEYATNFENLINYFPNLPLILVSDGQENAGNALKALQIRSRPAPIYPIVIDQQSIVSDFQIEKLAVPFLTDAGVKQDLSVVFKNNRSTKATGQIRIFQDDQLIKEERAEIAEGDLLHYSFSTNEIKSGLNKFTVEFANSSPSVDPLSFYVSGKEKNQVLVLTASAEESKLLQKALTDQKYQVVLHNSATGKIPDLDISKFQIVFLNNIPYRELPNKFVDSVKGYVAKGGALMMVGGNKSFGLGGYKNTVIEEVLPVNVLEPEKVQQRVNVAISLVLDKSGSMRSNQRMDFTKLAAQGIIQALKDDDYFGLIGFDNQPFIAVNMQQLSGGNRARATKLVDLLYPNGGTSLYPAMDVARQELELARAGRKHMIILTDGRLPDEAQLGSSYINMAQELKGTSISVSTFLIGGDDSRILREIATFGGGQFHRTRDAQSLPKLFLDDVRINTAEKTQKEYDQYVVKKSAGDLNVITKIDQFPEVLGYVETKIKQEAQLELVTTVVNDDPILAGWDYQGGRVVALTTDLSGRWSKKWVTWPKVYEFLEQTLKYLTPNHDGSLFSDFDFDYALKGQHLQLNLTTYQSVFQVGDFPLKIIWSDNTSQELSFLTTSKGYFQSEVIAPVAGLATILLGTPDGKEHQFKVEIPKLEQIERTVGIDKAFLNSIASLTGGEVNPKEIKASSTSQTNFKEKSLQQIFLILGLVMILLGILIREKIA